MLIYEATKGEFLKDAFDGLIIKKVREAYSTNNLNANSREFGSWEHSIQDYMYKILSSSSVPDDSGIAIEFRIPLTSKRVDFIISGYDEHNKGNVIIIELKQWSGKDTSKVVGKDGLVETFVGGTIRETTHPSYQVWSYYTFIKDFNESVQDNIITLYPCAYLHNFEQEYKGELDNEIYAHYVSIAPLYFKGDALKLKEFIEKHIRVGDNKKNLYEINSGKIRPSKSLQDSVCNMLKGNDEFVMIDSQKLVFENALHLALKSYKDGKKRVLIVEGGPGTGKSVVAINLLVKLLQNEMVVQYISKNSAPRNVYSCKLKGHIRTQEINHLFSGSGSFTDCKSDVFSTLIVDEAHRLNEKSGIYKHLGENQIKEIINDAKHGKRNIHFIESDCFDYSLKL